MPELEIQKIQETPQELAQTAKLQGIEAEIKALVVDSDEKLRTLQECRKSIDNYLTDIDLEKDPEIVSAERHLDFLKKRKARLVDPTKPIIKLCKDKQATYNEQKAERLKREEKERNEKKRLELQRKADDERREAEAKAAKEKEDREEQARKDREAAEENARIDRLAAEAKAKEEADQRKAELARANAEGVINKRELTKAAKEAEESAKAVIEQAKKEEEDRKRQAEEKERLDQKRAEEDAALALKQAQEKEQEAVKNFKPDKLVASRVPGGTLYRGGGNWEWEWAGDPDESIALVPRELLYPNDITKLAQFVRISALVRDTKDKEKAEAACPGIVVTYRYR